MVKRSWLRAMQQATGIKQIADAMNGLTQGGKNTATASKQIQGATEELRDVSRKLAFLLKGAAGFEQSAAAG